MNRRKFKGRKCPLMEKSFGLTSLDKGMFWNNEHGQPIKARRIWCSNNCKYGTYKECFYPKTVKELKKLSQPIST